MSRYYSNPRLQVAHRHGSSSSQAIQKRENTDDSIYIFPNPPSSPSSSSYSAPTNHEVSISFTSPSRSSENSTSRSRSELSFINVSPSADGREVEWEWNGDDEDFGVLELERQLDQWRSTRRDIVRMPGPQRPTGLQDRHTYIRSRTQSHLTTTSGFTNYDEHIDLSPHPTIRIPLLSFITSLFAVDEDTVHLLTHSTSHHGSVLFPGHNIVPAATESPDLEEVPNLHGLHKLLVSSDISSESWKSLRRGFEVVCSTAPVPSAIGLVTLWRYVNRVFIGRETAGKEILGDPVA